jgi:hypothetical protein
MNLKDILDLPKDFKSNSFDVNLKNLFIDYINVLKKNRVLIGKETNEIIEKAEYICEKINECLNDYNNGKKLLAFKNFSTALDYIKDDLLYQQGKPVILGNGIDHGFYKIRESEEILKGKKEYLHNPFENRYLLKDNRYSIPNIPNLYLGKSIWICWEELRKPSLDVINVSRFDIDKNQLKLFYLSQSPRVLISLFENPTNLKVEETQFTSMLSLLVRWPLMASCSIKVYDDDLEEKPEYIIPHLLLKYVQQSKKLDGILYFSTRLNNHSNNIPDYGTNLVLPAKNIQKKGYCNDLLKKIKLTEAISFKEFQHLPKKRTDEYTREEIDNWCALSVEGNLKDVMYQLRNKHNWYTIFGKLEIELCKMKTDYFSE